MQRFRHKHLFLSSLLLLWLGGCSPVRGYKLIGTSKVDKNTVLPIIDSAQSLLYKTNIQLYRKHYSGIILLKQTAPKTAHVTFVTEIGMKMFDYEISDSSFKLISIFEPINQPRITTMLESDMKLIVLYQLYKTESLHFRNGTSNIYKIKGKKRDYYTVGATHAIDHVRRKGIFFNTVKINYLMAEDLKPQEIKLRHKGLLRLKINLKRISKSEP
ncbi:MAG: hypothetical protein PSX36_16160 [bacterium]|nr:hypothetical protein [bacterium]